MNLLLATVACLAGISQASETRKTLNLHARNDIPAEYEKPFSAFNSGPLSGTSYWWVNGTLSDSKYTYLSPDFIEYNYPTDETFKKEKAGDETHYFVDSCEDLKKLPDYKGHKFGWLEYSLRPGPADNYHKKDPENLWNLEGEDAFEEGSDGRCNYLVRGKDGLTGGGIRGEPAILGQHFSEFTTF